MIPLESAFYMSQTSLVSLRIPSPSNGLLVIEAIARMPSDGVLRVKNYHSALEVYVTRIADTLPHVDVDLESIIVSGGPRTGKAWKRLA